MLKILIITYILLSIFLFDPKLYTGGDNVNYLILAKSIATGQGYRDLHKPMQPQHNQYPMGFPLMLAGLAIVGGGVFMAKIMVLLFGLGCLCYFYSLCKIIFKTNYWIPVVLFLTTPILIFYNHYILTEIPFLFFILGSLYYAIAYQRKGGFILMPIVSIAMAVAACLIKSMGIGLLMALILYFAITRRYICVVIAKIASLAILFIGGKSPYLTQLFARDPYNLSAGTVPFTEIVNRFWINMGVYIGQILPQSLYPEMHSSLIAVYSCILVVLIGYGVFVLWKKQRLIVFYFLSMTGIILIWPTIWAADRFLVPLIPIIIVFLILAFLQFQKKSIKIAVSVIILIGVMYNCVSLFKGSIGQTRCNFAYLQGDHCAGYSQDWRNYFETCEKLAGEKCTVIARKPEFVYWLSGNQSNIYKMDNDLSKIQTQLAGYDYVIVDAFQWTSSTDRYLIPALKHNNFGDNFRAVYKTGSPEFYLLKRT